MDDLKRLLDETYNAHAYNEDSERAIAQEIYVAAERLRQKRMEARQNICFALLAIAMAALLILCVRIGNLIFIPIGGALMTLLFAPILAYFIEEGRHDESY